MDLMLLAAAVAQPAPLMPDQVARIRPFVDCFKPMVDENNARSERDYVRFDDLFAKVKRECAAQRLVARDTLAAHVATQVLNIEGRKLPDDDGWKESLIDDATIKWMGRGFGSGNAQ